MSCSNRTVPMPWTTVFAASTSPVFLPATGWYPTNGVGKVRGVTEVRSLGPNMTVTFAYQVANVENSPGTGIAVGSTIDSEGVTYGTLVSVTSDTESKQLIRFGWNVALSTGSSLSIARVGGAVEVQSV